MTDTDDWREPTLPGDTSASICRRWELQTSSAIKCFITCETQTALIIGADSEWLRDAVVLLYPLCFGDADIWLDLLHTHVCPSPCKHHLHRHQQTIDLLSASDGPTADVQKMTHHYSRLSFNCTISADSMHYTESTKFCWREFFTSHIYTFLPTFAYHR